MPTVEYIKESEAPQAPKPMSKKAQDVLDVISGIKAGQVAKITPDEGQSLRGLKVSYGRVASNRGIKIQTWDDGQYLYVKKA